MSRLIDFYRGTSPDTEGRMLAQIWAYSDNDLEEVHDFIQWLFPLRDRSQFNPDAPLLTDRDIATFREEPQLLENLMRSFEVFLAFLGLRFEGGRVVEAEDFASKSGVWRYPNHNWLRITRVLASTRMLGLEGPSQAFFEFLKATRDGEQSGITTDTFRYWEQAAASPISGG